MGTEAVSFVLTCEVIAIFLDSGSIPGFERSPGEGTGSPLQYSCLENALGRGAWWATVHEVAKESNMAEQLSMHAHMMERELTLQDEGQMTDG